MKSLFTYFFFLLLVISALNNIAYAQWSNDPNVNNPICTTVNDQTDPIIISDGYGGAIIVWTDKRGGNPDIYAQRIDANGVIRWTTDGIVICVAADYQYLPTIVSDGNGGAIIAWVDNRYGNNYDIYAQRVDVNGVIQWLADGVAISTAANYQAYPTIVSDGSGGAIIIWQDRRNGVNYDIYAQHIDSNGAAQWMADGIIISAAVGHQEYPIAISDGSGGAISTWIDKRSGNYDIYSQLINSNGEVQWTANGEEICTELWEQSFPVLTGDGSGGAIIAWEDYRTSPHVIYAQSINASGIVRWTKDGVTISALAYSQDSPAIMNDANGGAIITWQVNSSGNDYDIYVQCIDANGLVQWTLNGVAICTAGHHQQDPTIIMDGSDGAIITWEDQRRGTNYDIYAQRIDANGVVQWVTDGVEISIATYDQIYPTEVSDGNGGAIITWQDYRVAYPDSVDIYTQQINTNGNLGVVTSILQDPDISNNFALLQNYPNPFNPSTTIQYRVSSNQFVHLKVYDVLGREVTTLVNEEKSAGNFEIIFDASQLSSGIYFYKMQAGSFVETKKMILIK